MWSLAPSSNRLLSSSNRTVWNRCPSLEPTNGTTLREWISSEEVKWGWIHTYKHIACTICTNILNNLCEGVCAQVCICSNKLKIVSYHRYCPLFWISHTSNIMRGFVTSIFHIIYSTVTITRGYLSSMCSDSVLIRFHPLFKISPTTKPPSSSPYFTCRTWTKSLWAVWEFSWI